MTERQAKALEAKARRIACQMARDFKMPTDASSAQVGAVLEAMRDEIATGIRILAAVSA